MSNKNGGTKMKNMFFITIILIMLNNIVLSDEVHLSDGSVFYGYLRNGLFEGNGKQIWKTGDMCLTSRICVPSEAGYT